MQKGSGTRSGLLWEVERLLCECEELPQILLMENVPQVHGKKNKDDFDKWISFLSSLGYTSVWQDLNAKDFGIPQNRNRCFMVSMLGNYTYEFPKGFPLELRLKDMLEENVAEKFYLSNEATQKLIDQMAPQERERERERESWSMNRKKTGKPIDFAMPLMARDYKGLPNMQLSNGVVESRTPSDPEAEAVQTGTVGIWYMNEIRLGNIYGFTGGNFAGNVYDAEGLCPCLRTFRGGNQQPMVIVYESEEDSNAP